MNLLSHSFVRNRVISLATTLSVGATSLALAHGPMPGHRLHDFINRSNMSRIGRIIPTKRRISPRTTPP